MEADPNYDGPNCDVVYERIQFWLDRFVEVFGEPMCGRNRAVFRSGNYVYKVPLDMAGVSDNEHEAWAQDQYDHRARCRVLYDEDRGDGIPILVMERVQYAHHSKEPWTYGVDCSQVGYSVVTGELVAYDYGYS